MNVTKIGRSSATRLGVGLAAGVGIAAVDNFASGGEVNPIVIVGMLVVATFSAGAVWGRDAWMSAVVVWACAPVAHLIRHFFGLPDTLHPNTYGSIAMLAGFTFVIATLGTVSGILSRTSRRAPDRR